MKEVAISEFKAKCLTILEEVRVTKTPVLVTRHGKPVAEVSAPSKVVKRSEMIGALKGRMKILGDIISPADDEDDWEVLRD
jgi:antitoxin (DNA-binding transcriptional repressor) of toxin-antitoxin stability system